jgi:energy-coupling factor transporter ATP-binding protein EcfA2
MHIRVQSVIEETPRVLQVRGLFDLPPEKTSAVEWDIDAPIHTKPWNIGLITGPSGCGKSTLARELFPPDRSIWVDTMGPWPTKECVLDGFPASLSVKEMTELLGAVGFSSPPAWLRPFHALSTGQRFRCELARLLTHGAMGALVFDEFTSVVDRTVARIGSAAVARAVRTRNHRMVAVSCHDDVIDWLQPDWILNPGSGEFAWRRLRRRPEIVLEVTRCSSGVWPLFAPHHYLSTSLAGGAWCFLATRQEGGRHG